MLLGRRDIFNHVKKVKSKGQSFNVRISDANCNLSQNHVTICVEKFSNSFRQVYCIVEALKEKQRQRIICDTGPLRFAPGKQRSCSLTLIQILKLYSHLKSFHLYMIIIVFVDICNVMYIDVTAGVPHALLWFRALFFSYRRSHLTFPSPSPSFHIYSLSFFYITIELSTSF